MARRQGLTSPEPVRLAVHPNGYFSEVAIRFKDATLLLRQAAAVSDALKPFAFEQQAPLLARIVSAVRRSSDPGAIDWRGIAATWSRVKELAAERPHAARPTPPRVHRRPTGVRDVLARNGISAARARSRPTPGAVRRAPRRGRTNRLGSRSASHATTGATRACGRGVSHSAPTPCSHRRSRWPRSVCTSLGVSPRSGRTSLPSFAGCARVAPGASRSTPTAGASCTRATCARSDVAGLGTLRS